MGKLLESLISDLWLWDYLLALHNTPDFGMWRVNLDAPRDNRRVSPITGRFLSRDWIDAIGGSQHCVCGDWWHFIIVRCDHFKALPRLVHMASELGSCQSAPAKFDRRSCLARYTAKSSGIVDPSPPQIPCRYLGSLPARAGRLVAFVRFATFATRLFGKWVTGLRF